MVRMAIVGMGGMGNMHLGIYNRLESVEVVAVCDKDVKKLKAGQTEQQINIGTGGGTLDLSKVKLYRSLNKLLADPAVEAVDICVPTPLHKRYAVAALQAGKHVLCEKPMGKSPREAMEMVDAAEASGKTLMIAQCIRFWPEYAYLKEAVDSSRLGRLLSLQMWRYSAPPTWGWQNWFMQGKKSGGALLDLHVHDVDFVISAFGKPSAVSSQGAVGPSGEIDAIVTQYSYGPDKIITTTGNWCLADGFYMAYLAIFEKGHIQYDLRLQPALEEVTAEGKKTPEVSSDDG